jgi:hypothetical protein
MAARHKHRVPTGLEGFEQVQNVHPAGAGHQHDLHGRGILQAHGARQISPGVGTPTAADAQDLGIVFLTHLFPF